jgi:hypothetical protein
VQLVISDAHDGLKGPSPASSGSFRAREVYPYLWLDATYVTVSEAGRAVSMAVLVATGVAESGERRVLGRELAPGNDEGSAWPAFIGRARRARPGGRAPGHQRRPPGAGGGDEATLLGAGWQRSSVQTAAGPRVPVSHPSGERLGSGDRLQILRQTRASAREASLYRPEGDVPRAPAMSVQGGLCQAA